MLQLYSNYFSHLFAKRPLHVTSVITSVGRRRALAYDVFIRHTHTPLVSLCCNSSHTCSFHVQCEDDSLAYRPTITAMYFSIHPVAYAIIQGTIRWPTYEAVCTTYSSVNV